MERSIAILGRQPAIGMAELESLYGEAVMPIGMACFWVGAGSVTETTVFWNDLS